MTLVEEFVSLVEAMTKDDCNPEVAYCWWCRVDINGDPEGKHGDPVAPAPHDDGCLWVRAQDLIAKASAASDERAREAWQPIETAPMDGTEVLLCELMTNGSYGTIEHGSWGFIESSDWDGAAVYGWMSDFGSIEEPTHWMPKLPLPSAPPLPSPTEGA